MDPSARSSTVEAVVDGRMSPEDRAVAAVTVPSLGRTSAGRWSGRGAGRETEAATTAWSRERDGERQERAVMDLAGDRERDGERKIGERE